MFITFEGVEGAGKTTAIEAVARHLTSCGEKVCRTREPGGCPLGQQLRPFHNGLLRLLQGGDAFIDLADDFFRGGRRGLCFGGLAHIYSCAVLSAS